MSFCGHDHVSAYAATFYNELCFRKYSILQNPREYAPMHPITRKPVIPLSCCPADAPIIDHLESYLIDSKFPGGSWKPWIIKSIERIQQKRQVCVENPEGETYLVRYGVSSLKALEHFTTELHKAILGQMTPELGFFPCKFYSFDVENVALSPGSEFKILVPDGSGDSSYHTVGGVTTKSFPARVHMAVYGKRFDVIFPWANKEPTYDYRGDYLLKLEAPALAVEWFNLWNDLPGLALGVGIREDIQLLTSFIHQVYKFQDCAGRRISIRHGDLTVLLALSGHNSPKTSVAALNFLYTGGFVLKPWPVRCGFGRWSDIVIHTASKVYLTAEAESILNVATTAILGMLVHWFPSPGVAAAVSHKSPTKFMLWFSRFVDNLLDGAYLPVQSSFHSIGCRVTDPLDQILSIQYDPGKHVVFTPEEVAQMVPTWNHITRGGALTDLQVVRHVCDHILPILILNETPSDVDWVKYYSTFASEFLGLKVPSLVSDRPESHPNVDENSIRMKEDIVSVIPTVPVRSYLHNFLSTLAADHPFRQMDISSVLQAYAWFYPTRVKELFYETLLEDEDCEADPLSMPECFFVEPIITACNGGPLYKEEPRCWTDYKTFREHEGAIKYKEALEKRLKIETNEKKKKNQKTSLGRLRKKLREDDSVPCLKDRVGLKRSVPSVSDDESIPSRSTTPVPSEYGKRSREDEDLREYLNKRRRLAGATAPSTAPSTSSAVGAPISTPSAETPSPKRPLTLVERLRKARARVISSPPPPVAEPLPKCAAVPVPELSLKEQLLSRTMSDTASIEPQYDPEECLNVSFESTPDPASELETFAGDLSYSSTDFPVEREWPEVDQD